MSTLPTTSPRPFSAGRSSRISLTLCLLLILYTDRALAACDPWPGEPEPLPTLADPDPVRARWALLHSRELRDLAFQAEDLRSIDGYRIWQHLRCLDPENAEARRGMSRTYPILIHRPRVSVVEGVEPEIHPGRGDPWSAVGKPVVVYIEPPPPPPVPKKKIRKIRARIEPAEPEIDHAALAAERARRIEELGEQIAKAGIELRRARFRLGLATLQPVREALANLEEGEDLTPLAVQLETLAATAHVALGQQQEARSSLARALSADPGFELDPATTSPKVLLAFHLARATLRRQKSAR